MGAGNGIFGFTNLSTQSTSSLVMFCPYHTWVTCYIVFVTLLKFTTLPTLISGSTSMCPDAMIGPESMARTVYATLTPVSFTPSCNQTIYPHICRQRNSYNSNTALAVHLSLIPCSTMSILLTNGPVTIEWWQTRLKYPLKCWEISRTVWIIIIVSTEKLDTELWQLPWMMSIRISDQV